MVSLNYKLTHKIMRPIIQTFLVGPYEEPCMRLSILLNSIALLAISHSALAAQGGTSGGGGNTLHGKLIETYGGHSVHELKGYDAAIARLTALVPTFAIRQAQGMAAKQIYLIPESFGPLPLRATQLDFETDLPCYQTEDEVFCNPEKLDEMSASEQSDLFIHEAAMNARLADSDGGPSIGDLRAAVATLIRPNVTEAAAASILAARNFGAFVTASVYQKAERSRVALEKGDLDLCRRGPNNWDVTNDGNPFFHLQGLLESKLSIDYGSAMDIQQAWVADDVLRYGTEKMDPNESGEVDQLIFCLALYKKFHTR